MSVKSAYESIANEYDSQYENSLYWKVSDDITIRHMMKWIPSSGKVIDIGCGTGEYGLHFLKRGFDVDFSDLSSEMLNIVAEKICKLNLDYDPKLIELDLCKSDFELSENYNVIIAEGDVLGYCLDKAAQIIEKLEKNLAEEGVIFIGLDNMIINIMNTARTEGIYKIEDFIRNGKTRCPMGLPIKQYSVESFKKIIPTSLKIVEAFGKPIIVPYLDERNKAEIMIDSNKYAQLINLEEDAIKQGYSALGSHFTFVLMKNVQGNE